MRSVLWSPELNQMIRALRSEVPNLNKWFALCALNSRTEPNDLRSEVPSWTKWFALWSPELNQMICALKPRTEPNDLRSALWSPELNQMICALRSEVPNLIKWFALWSPELNQMICALRSEVPNWTKWFALCALKSRTEQLFTKAARSALINAVLSGIIGKMKWKCQWHISEDSWFPSEIHKHPRCVLAYSMTSFLFEV